MTIPERPKDPEVDSPLVDIPDPKPDIDPPNRQAPLKEPDKKTEEIA